MNTKALFAWLTGFISVVYPLVVAAQTTKAARPNILWLIAEDFGQHLGCYGTKEVWTPNLDRLAAEGVRYTRVFTAAPVCSPSRSAFMTGMEAITIGAHNHRSHRDDGYQLPQGVGILTDWLRDVGYFTLNIRQLPPGCGFRGTGKTDWNFHYGGNFSNQMDDLKTSSPFYAKPFDSDKWADLKTHQPFYAQINFSETHRKFSAPKRADPAKVEIPPYYPDHPVTRADWAAYLDAASELDRKVGRILQQLETDGLADNTIVVFFGDNGQAHVRGKQFVYDSGLLVPMIIRWPKNLPRPKQILPGFVDSRLISAIDLAPTMLSLAGADKPRRMQGRIFLGDKAESPRTFVFGARDRCDETVFRLRTVRDAHWRYIRNSTPERPFLQTNEYKAKQYPVWNLLSELHTAGKLDPVQDVLCASTMPAEELYNIEKDPHEIHNLIQAPNHHLILLRLRGALDEWMTQCNDQGRQFEPNDVATRKGATKVKTP